MAFPETSVLDTFTRTESPPITGWSSDLPWSTYTGFSTNGTQLTAAGAWYQGYWNAGTFAEDQEAYVTCVTGPDTGAGHLFVRLTGSADSPNCYMLSYSFDDVGPGPYLERMVGGSITTMQSFSTALSDGDKLGIRAVGSSITAWRDSGGGWTQMGTTSTDSNVTGAGYIGLYVGTDATASVYDDFGGGAVTAAPSLYVAKSSLRW